MQLPHTNFSAQSIAQTRASKGRGMNGVPWLFVAPTSLLSRVMGHLARHWVGIRPALSVHLANSTLHPMTCTTVSRNLWLAMSPLLACAWLYATNHCSLGIMVRGIPQVCAERSCCQKEGSTPSNPDREPTKSGQCCLDAPAILLKRPLTPSTAANHLDSLSQPLWHAEALEECPLALEFHPVRSPRVFFAVVEFFKVSCLLPNAPPSAV